MTFEKLVGDLNGAYSRRINLQHRLVYQIYEEEKTIKILSLWTHYERLSLFRLPCGKLPLAFLAVPTGKDGRVECPCQTVNDFIGIRESVCGLFLFVQTHAPLDIGKQYTMCLLLCCLVFNICECGFQRSKIVLMLVNNLQNHITLCIIGHLLQLVVE